MKLTAEQLAEVARHYGVSVDTSLPPQKGYRNVSYAFEHRHHSTWYNFIVYKSEPAMYERIQRTNMLGEALQAAEVPARCVADDRIMLLWNGNVGAYGSLYYYLRGETIAWEAYTMKHIKLLGWVLADVHAAFRTVDKTGFPTVVDEYNAILKRMASYFTRPTIQHASHMKLNLRLDTSTLDYLQGFLQACRTLPDQQILHMDMVRGNVLFEPAHKSSRYAIQTVACSGVLDFEKAAVGHVLFDLARSLAFLLVDCSRKSERQIRSYFLHSGYAKRGGAKIKATSVTSQNGTNYDVLEAATNLFLMYDFYKFLRDNPYESLAQNYHFVRTRNILLAKNLLHYI